MKNKQYALELLKKKINGEEKITYKQISKLTGYSKRQLIRLSVKTEEKDIDSILVHGNVAKPSHNSASSKEIEFIKTFKEKYPVITISQFQDIYNEDIIFNPKMTEDITRYNLNKRSYSFF